MSDKKLNGDELTAWRVGITARCDAHVTVADSLISLKCGKCLEKQTERATAELRLIRESQNDGA
jgi:hypothetical protein